MILSEVNNAKLTSCQNCTVPPIRAKHLFHSPSTDSFHQTLWLIRCSEKRRCTMMLRSLQKFKACFGFSCGSLYIPSCWATVGRKLYCSKVWWGFSRVYETMTGIGWRFFCMMWIDHCSRNCGKKWPNISQIGIKWSLYFTPAPSKNW